MICSGSFSQNRENETNFLLGRHWFSIQQTENHPWPLKGCLHPGGLSAWIETHEGVNRNAATYPRGQSLPSRSSVADTAERAG